MLSPSAFAFTCSARLPNTQTDHPIGRFQVVHPEYRIGTLRAHAPAAREHFLRREMPLSRGRSTPTGGTEHNTNKEFDMNSTKKIVMLASVGLAATFGGQQAEARAVGSAMGRAVNSAQASCLGVSGEGITNNCSADVTWVMDLPVDSSGWWSVTVSARGSATNKVSCQSTETDKHLGSLSTSGAFQNLSAANADDDIGLAPVNVDATGQLYVVCIIKQTGQVRVVNWTK